MPSRRSGGKRRVRYVAKDGSVKVYEYDRRPKPKPRTGDTLAALIETYRKSPDWRRLAESTRTSRLIAYDHLEPIHDHTVSGLTRRNIVGIRDQLADKPGTATTVLIAIKALLSWAVNHDWIEVNPALGVKGFGTTRGNRRWHDHEVRAVLDHPEIPERVKLAVMLALYTGQRRTDCIRMQWSAYDGRIIRLRQQKTGTELVIPVHPGLKAALDREPRKALTILTSSAGTPWTAPGLYKAIQSALDKAGIVGATYHGLRVTAATKLAELGAGAFEIAAITGHKTISMVQRYVRDADQHRQAEAAMERLAGAWESKNDKVTKLPKRRAKS
jgi:integrase